MKKRLYNYCFCLIDVGRPITLLRGVRSTGILLLLLQVLFMNVVFGQAVASNTNKLNSKTYPFLRNEEALQENDEKILLEKALINLEEKYKISFGYSPKIIRDKYVSVSLLSATDEVALEQKLHQVLDPLKLIFEKLDDKNYVIYASDTKMKRLSSLYATEDQPSLPQVVNDVVDEVSTSKAVSSDARRNIELIVSGKVNSLDDPAGIPGVNVLVKGTSIGTSTDANGEYKIEVPSAESTLIFSSIGYSTEEVVVGDKTAINVTLSPDIQSLSEVIVVGYGTQRKTDITTAVATFKTEQIQERPLVRVDQALVGQMAGVRVKQTSGVPGKGFNIQVRGTGSISASAEPLYVVDGFPMEPAVQNASGGFSTGNPMDNINPNDIESIQVLKDAAAAAIYGSRAANGVVIIKTKGGQAGKAKIGFSSYVGVSQTVKKLDVLSGSEWIDRAIETENYNYVGKFGKYGATAADNNDTRRTIMTNAPLVDQIKVAPGAYNTNYMPDERWFNIDPAHPNVAPDGLKYVDWQNELFRTGVTQNYEINASGGTETVKYFLSGGYLDQQGTAIGLDYKRYSARANVEIKATQKLKLGINITPSYSIQSDPGVEGKDQQLHIAVSEVPVIEANVTPATTNVGPISPYLWGQTRNSPVAVIKNSIGDTKSFRTLSTIFAEYQLIKDLTFKSSLNFDNQDGALKRWAPAFITGSSPTSRATTGSTTDSRRQNFVNENTLNFSKRIGENHSLSLLAGHSYSTFRYNTMTITGSSFTSDVISTLNAATVFALSNTSETKSVLISYFGRAQYSFKDRYLFSASIRRDGSSRFGNTTKWGYFPSASVGWRISQENFMQNTSNFVSELKLRGSWGVSGNNNIGDYSAIAVQQFSNTSFGTTGTLARGVTPQNFTNPNLGWEKSSTYDVGLDFGLIQNRISASLDYYYKDNTNLLLNVPVPTASGFNSAITTSLSNIGEVVNKGWEIELHTRNLVGALQWNTDFNLSHNKNEVKKLGPNNTPILDNSGFDIPSKITQVGSPMGSVYVVREIGVLSPDDIANGYPRYNNEEAGDPKYFDANGDGKIDASDEIVVASPYPDFTWGITNNFKFKGFDLNVLIQGQNGGHIYSMYGRAVDRTGQGVTDNTLGKYRDRWRSPDDPGNGPHKWPSSFGFIKNTNWLYSSDYVRVRNITLGYNMKAYLLKTRALSAARVYVTAENWFGRDYYYGGFNPEGVNTNGEDYGAYPLSKSIIVGINLTF